MAARTRRCASCRTPLPAGASARRRYCEPRCVAAAYRRRQKIARLTAITKLVLQARSAPPGATDAEVDATWAAWRIVRHWRCPGCGTTVWRGAGVRADAVHCSPKCRTRSYRARQAPSWPSPTAVT